MTGRACRIFFAFFFLLMLSGCGGGQTKEQRFQEKVEAFKEDIKKAGSEESGKNNKKIHIGSVNMGMNGEWFSEVMNGIWDASEDLGAKVTMLDSANDMELEKKHVKTLVDEGIDALVISPRDSKESIKALAPAIEKNIPIITWNTSVDMDVTSFVCVDSEALGGDTGDYLCEYIKTYDLSDVKLIIIDNKNYDVGIARCEGFEESIKSMVDQGYIEIAARGDAETFEASSKLTEKLIRENPDATALWAWNQPSLLGAIDAVKRSGRNDMLIMGTDMSMELAEDMLRDDIKLLAVTTQMPYNMGYKAVETAVRVVNGQEVEKNVLIPLYTYKRTDRDLVERYLVVHKGLVEWSGGQQE